MPRRFAANARHHVVVDTMRLQEPKAAHHLVEGSAPVAVLAIAVMDFLWSVQADPDNELMALQKRAPGVIEQHPVGLQGIADRLGRSVRRLQFDHFLKKCKPHQGRLAALPNEFDHRRWLGSDIVLDIPREHLV